MTAVTADLTVLLDGKTILEDQIPVEPGGHYLLNVTLEDQGPCDCAPASTPAKSETVSTEEELDLLPAGTVVADKDHDDWEKSPVTGEWVHKGGPHLRAKTLIALWGPFTVVRVP